MMKAQSLKSNIDNLHKEIKVEKNIILKFYVFERFIERLSISSYKNNFIVKGGYILSNVLGCKGRTTKDIDFSLKDVEFTYEEVVRIITDIIAVNLDDDVKFNMIKVTEIKGEDDYGGYRVFLEAKIVNITERIYIDLATGDKVTPSAITFTFRKLFDDTEISILSYNFETILSEKIETILSKAEISSRMKDYYDIYIIYTLFHYEIDNDLLITALSNTITNRGTEYIYDEYSEILNKIVSNANVKKLWKQYLNSNDIKDDIKIEYITKIIYKIMSKNF
ncbi:nucleotidyl transferase AbiEii/AbiGii toxin family protein [Mycoplasma sp. P36-A1]|uniref:nucleotidyl transferase AbiEii/AbiGii toxin family protein n=1 Tax=Mycoplasma sp. P36-A1 TaxID=3252900 RepID=UPI003C30727E